MSPRPYVSSSPGVWGWRDRTKITKETNGYSKKSPFIILITPFIGRGIIFDLWFENFKKLKFPHGQTHILWLCATVEKKFIKILKKAFSSLEDYHTKTLIITQEIPIYSEGGEKPDLWVKRNDGITQYLNFARYYSEQADYVFLWEDDVLVPDDSLKKTIPFMANQHIGAIVMRCPYRPDGINRGKPLAWSIEPTYEIFNGTVNHKYDTKFMEMQEDGVEEIGGGTTGCHLIRQSLFSKIPFVNMHKGISGPDVSYGQRLREVGYKTLIHWGVHCGHMNVNKNKVEVFR